MHRLVKALLLLVAFVVVGETALSQALPIVQIRGRLPQGQLQVFTKDKLYQVTGEYYVAGTLLIEPGTTVEFLPNGRLIDSVGGKIVADGNLSANWDGNTSVVTSYANRYCDVQYVRDHVTIGATPERTAPAPFWGNFVPRLLFYYANGLDRCATDPNKQNTPYLRNVSPAPITFRGRPVTVNSREWGHIVILPGADSAVFRNCNFVNFRKDVQTTSNAFFYSPTTQVGYTSPQVNAGSTLNTAMRNLTAGGGGAMTVFSSKTWILDCRFDSNFARHHGGAIQFLQAPYDATGQFYRQHPSYPNPGNSPFFYPPVNPETFDLYGGATTTPFGALTSMTVTTPTGATSQYRQGFDDGRQAVNAGRVRRLIFRDNRVVVGDVVDNNQGYRDVTTVFPVDPNGGANSITKNEAYGGAVYVSGRRFVTVYWGGALGDPTDTIVCERNHAVNFQNAATSNGAKGGAFFVGDSTSMVFKRARFVDNFTAVPNVPTTDFTLRGTLSQGGGIYMSSTSPELTVRDTINFRGNNAARGGGIYVAAVAIPTADPFISPNLLGDAVYFVGNKAEYDGGAIFTQRNMSIESRWLTRVDSTAPGLPLLDRRILLDSNVAGLSGGAVVIDYQGNPSNSKARIEKVLFSNNSVGDTALAQISRLIKLYDPVASPFQTPFAEFGTTSVLDTVKLRTNISTLAQEVLGGGAIYSINGNTNFFRAVEFLRNRTIGGNGGAISMITPALNNRYFLAMGDSAYDFNIGAPIGFISGPEPKDQREMTRFLGNVAKDDQVSPVLNRNPHNFTGTRLGDPNRNGTGLGGAIYINDLQPGGGGAGTPRTDSVITHRVRIERDSAYSGSAVYSDNYQLRVILNKALVANNIAYSAEGRNVDVISNYKTSPAASRTAAATFYGDIQGPMPSERYHTNANSIYDNDARFLVRLPDAPAGQVGQGESGVDTLRGNFWGETQAPVTTVLPTGSQQNTFYVAGLGCTLPLKNPSNVNQQGPFESPRMPGETGYYTYNPVPVGVIPDTLLMEGRIYDIFDKGVDIKAADYSMPRLAPIEDFSVGIPKRLRQYATGVYQGKVVRRLTRDPFVVDTNTSTPLAVRLLQREFVGNHPIGYPLFLEANANYLGNANLDNNDQYALNHTVFFVINVETGEFIRTTMKQVTEGSPLFRSRVEFVADSINRDPLARRTREGRAAFSTGELYRLSPRYYLETSPSFPTKLDTLKFARQRAAEYEDSVAVAGRRYGGAPAILGGNGFSFTNRVNPITFADIYAGERYHALPVKTGDRVWVISRTALWNTDDSLVTVLNNARATGLQFTIDTIANSVSAPIVRGQRNQLEAKTPTELRNTRFLTEDQVYSSDTTGAIESPIFEVTADDINGFFDPRYLFFPDRYTGLRYEWSPLVEFPQTNATQPSRDPKLVRLASWLKADTVFPNDVAPAAVNRDTAHSRGFVRFYGTPHNPDVVPGGEILEVKVSNYPPGIRTIDSLKGLLPDSVVKDFLYLYPPYFNCQVYDPVTARYLQQDTVDVGGASTTSYRLRIFVQDKPPVMSDVRPCTNVNTGEPVANLTNKLRFNFDVNSDDETEDQTAFLQGWDFKYGRTTYGFVFTDRPNQDVYSPDTTVTDDVREIRPVWMGDQYLRDSNATQVDNGATLMTTGKVVVRIDSTSAINLLRNPAQANNAFNLDTVFTVFANDGHTGQNKHDVRVTVNVAPQLQPVPALGGYKLPNAREDYDYNPQLRDTLRRIAVSDLNLGQRVRYYLLYKNDGQNDALFKKDVTSIDSAGQVKTNTDSTAYIRRDNCYPEAGLFFTKKTTPDWLKINTFSGMLYGTPGLNDAPRTVALGNPETVTVVVIDEGGLTDVRTYQLEVDSTNHRPRLVGRPPIQCVEAGKPYTDSLCVSDRDFGRVVRFAERVTLQVVEPQGVFTVNPNVINGTTTDTVCFSINAASIPANLAGQKISIKIQATDAAGNFDTLRYQISVSEATIFSMPVYVSNTNVTTGSNGFQRLEFGIANNATTGDEPPPLQGTLDSNYCEYELPPLPPDDVFDSRWTIVTRNGILRSIFPQVPSPDQGIVAWKASFQSGNQGGSPNYPIKICWNMKEAQKSPKQLELRDPTDAVFNVDMKTGAYRANSGVTVRRFTSNPDSICVEINLTQIKGFKIVYDPSGLGVDDEPTTGLSAYTLASNVPNPFAKTTEISYFAPRNGAVKLEIFDIHGSLVKTLVDGAVVAGNHTVTWDGTDAKGTAVASGSYTYRLTAGNTVLTRTMVLMK